MEIIRVPCVVISDFGDDCKRGLVLTQQECRIYSSVVRIQCDSSVIVEGKATRLVPVESAQQVIPGSTCCATNLEPNNSGNRRTQDYAIDCAADGLSKLLRRTCRNPSTLVFSM